MTSDKIWQRSDILNTQVITRDTGRRLGVVNQLWVDLDERQVVALGLRDNLLSGLVAGVPKFMLLRSMRQIGDVILVDNDTVIEDIDVEGCSNLVQSEVITENGDLLGRVRGFKFNVENGKLISIIIASLGLPLIPDQVISTYELSIDEVVSSGPNRLIVIEGAEDRLNQLSVGLLERVGLGKAPWERDEEEEYYTIPTVSVDHQLPSGQRVPMTRTERVSTPVVEPAWSEDDWQGSEPSRRQLRQQQRQPEPYYEEEDWSEANDRDRYRNRYEEDEDEYEYEYEQPVQQRAPQQRYAETPYDEDDLREDPWGTEEESYQAPRVNIPEKTKMPEYEEDY